MNKIVEMCKKPGFGEFNRECVTEIIILLKLNGYQSRATDLSIGFITEDSSHVDCFGFHQFQVSEQGRVE